MTNKLRFACISWLISLAVFPLLAAESPPVALRIPAPKLARAELFCHTKGHKDKDTAISVYITTADGKKTLAQLQNAIGSPAGQDRIYGAAEYFSGSDHILKLRRSAPSTKPECDGFKVKVKIEAPHGDQWQFNGFVVLYFSDNTTMTKTKDDLEVVSKDSAPAEVEF